VSAIPEKPNNITPLLRLSDEALQKSKEVLAAMCVLKNEDCTPEQQNVLPQTSNQEYGFLNKPLVSKALLFDHPMGGCDVTRYAQAYVSMTGRSPYATEDSS
jgi:hypothetical protein